MDDFITLASGQKMPLVGFGLWKIPAEKTADTVYNAVKVGYRLFDGAYDYQNEREAGQGVRRAIEEGLVRRDDIFITSKLWNNYHQKEHALAMAKSQNEAWGLGYIDLYLIHFPLSLKYIDPNKLKYPGWWVDHEQKEVGVAKVPLRETWEALEETLEAGIVRAIGISNASGQTLYDMLTYNRYPISSLQIEHHPYLVQAELVQLAQENGIAVSAYWSFGPQSFQEMPVREVDPETSLLFDAGVVKKAAERTSRTTAQVLLRWATQRKIGVVPRSQNPIRLKQNLEVTDFNLTDVEIKEISSLDKGWRLNDPGFYLSPPLRIFA